MLGGQEKDHVGIPHLRLVPIYEVLLELLENSFENF